MSGLAANVFILHDAGDNTTRRSLPAYLHTTNGSPYLYDMHSQVGKYVIAAGVIIVFIGIVLYFFADKLHWIGRLPGDIRIERENFRFYFPLTTMILISVLINIILRLIRRI